MQDSQKFCHKKHKMKNNTNAKAVHIWNYEPDFLAWSSKVKGSQSGYDRIDLSVFLD